MPNDGSPGHDHPGRRRFTVACWVRLATVDGQPHVFDIGTSPTVHMYLTPVGPRGPVRFDDVDREVIALRGRLLTEAQATEMLDGTALVRSVLSA